MLGLPENAPKDMVEKKYGVLIRQYKARTDEHGVMDEDAKYYQTITDAYNRIMGFDPNNYDDNPTSVVPYRIRRFGGKLATLFDQYKLVLMIVVFVIAAAVIVIVQSRTATEYDLNIKFIGSLIHWMNLHSARRSLRNPPFPIRQRFPLHHNDLQQLFA